jgi:hypothetical protein
VTTIQIDPQFENWVQENVVKKFELKGIEVTLTARLGLAYLMQAQLEERTARTPEQVLLGAERLLGPILTGYHAKYKSAPLTINRALHLITEMNAHLLAFPWAPTMDLTEIKSNPEIVEEGQWEKEGQH